MTQATRYRLSLHGKDGETLWVELPVGPRDVFWAAGTLGDACLEGYDSLALWRGRSYLLGARTLDARHLSDGMNSIALATQQLVADTEEILAQSHKILANSQRLLEATTLLRQRLEKRGLINLREPGEDATVERNPRA